MTFAWKRILSLGMVLCMLLSVLPVTALALEPADFTDKRDLALEQLRDGLAAHDTQIDVYYKTINVLTDAQLTSLFSDAVMGDASIGDDMGYRRDYVLFSVTDVAVDAEYTMHDIYVYHKITYSVSYMTDDAQEAWLRETVTKLTETMTAETRNDYQRCKWVYDYVQNNVTIDPAASGSAYAALQDGKANADGVAALVYCLLMNSGVHSRIVAGGGCAWNLVRVYDKWYVLDAACGRLLCGSEGHADHSADEYYTSKSFQKAYPLQAQSFEPMVAAGSLENGFKWSYDAGAAAVTVSGEGAMQDFAMTTVGGMQVVSRPWDAYVTEGASFMVSEGVTALGANVFYNVLFEEIQLPASLTHVGAGAFRSSRGEEIKLPEGLLSVGDEAFQNSQVLRVQLPDTVTEIGDRAFGGCVRLETLGLSAALTAVGEGVCEGCVSLRTVTYPRSSEEWRQVALGGSNQKIIDLLRSGDGGFFDVPADAWYAEAVSWAAARNVTGGVGNGSFGSDAGCTRAQVVTFLYAAAGKPAVKAAENPFEDVSKDDWFYTPVMWAVQNGITGGIDASHFGPDLTCTRAQIVTFLYAAADKPEITAGSSFHDVADTDWYAKPVIWAKENGVTGGIGKDQFGPNVTCTRAQVVTFLYKAYGNK